MSRAKVNLVIDGVMTLLMAGIAGIGLLIKYVLVPGYLRWEIYERNVKLFFLGLDRHQWGFIHLAMGYVLLGLIVLHIVLHWSMVVEIYRKMVSAKSARWVVGLVFLGLIIFLSSFFFFVKPEVQEAGGGGHGHEHSVSVDSGTGH